MIWPPARGIARGGPPLQLHSLLGCNECTPLHGDTLHAEMVWAVNRVLGNRVEGASVCFGLLLDVAFCRARDGIGEQGYVLCSRLVQCAPCVSGPLRRPKGTPNKVRRHRRITGMLQQRATVQWVRWHTPCPGSRDGPFEPSRPLFHLLRWGTQALQHASSLCPTSRGPLPRYPLPSMDESVLVRPPSIPVRCPHA